MKHWRVKETLNMILMYGGRAGRRMHPPFCLFVLGPDNRLNRTYPDFLVMS